MFQKYVLGIETMNDIQKAVGEATSVLIVLPNETSDKDYLAALQLQKLAPEKMLLVAPEAKEVLWRDVFGSTPQKKEFAISINTAISPVDELRYEREGETLTILLTHAHPFDRSAISLSEHLPQADLLITIGFLTQASAERAIDSLPRKGAARHIWIEDYAGANGSQKITSPSSMGLLGRLLVRSRHDPDLGILWSFITRDDFAKTDSTPTDIPNLIETCSSIISLPRAVIVFWQYNEGKGTDGIFWSQDLVLNRELSRVLGKNASGEHIVDLTQYANFIEAETTLRKLLRSIL